MGDYGLNQTFEYSEIQFDSWDTVAAAGSLNPSTAADKYSWPRFNFTSKQPNVAAIKILQAEIPFVWDVINSKNNTFVYTAAGVPTTITIPAGTYTGVTLAAQLQTLLAAVTVGFTVTYSTTTLKFTFTQAAAIAWSLGFATRQTAYSPLGFIPGGSYTATGVGSTIVSNIVAQVTGPNYLYLNSTKFGSLLNNNTTDGANQANSNIVIAKIPVNANYGSTVFYTDPDPNKYFDFFAGNEITNFTFFLTLGSDQYQFPLDMKGASWSLKLGVLSYRQATDQLYKKQKTSQKIIGA